MPCASSATFGVCSNAGTCVTGTHMNGDRQLVSVQYCVCDSNLGTNNGDLVWSNTDCPINERAINPLYGLVFAFSLLVLIWVWYRWAERIYYSHGPGATAHGASHASGIGGGGGNSHRDRSCRQSCVDIFWVWPNRIFVYITFVLGSIVVWAALRLFTGEAAIGQTIGGTILFIVFQNATNLLSHSSIYHFIGVLVKTSNLDSATREHADKMRRRMKPIRFVSEIILTVGLLSPFLYFIAPTHDEFDPESIAAQNDCAIAVLVCFANSHFLLGAQMWGLMYRLRNILRKQIILKPASLHPPPLAHAASTASHGVAAHPNPHPPPTLDRVGSTGTGAGVTPLTSTPPPPIAQQLIPPHATGNNHAAAAAATPNAAHHHADTLVPPTVTRAGSGTGGALSPVSGAGSGHAFKFNAAATGGSPDLHRAHSHSHSNNAGGAAGGGGGAAVAHAHHPPKPSAHTTAQDGVLSLLKRLDFLQWLYPMTVMPIALLLYATAIVPDLRARASYVLCAVMLPRPIICYQTVNLFTAGGAHAAQQKQQIAAAHSTGSTDPHPHSPPGPGSTDAKHAVSPLPRKSSHGAHMIHAHAHAAATAHAAAGGTTGGGGGGAGSSRRNSVELQHPKRAPSPQPLNSTQPIAAASAASAAASVITSATAVSDGSGTGSGRAGAGIRVDDSASLNQPTAAAAAASETNTTSTAATGAIVRVPAPVPASVPPPAAVVVAPTTTTSTATATTATTTTIPISSSIGGTTTIPISGSSRASTPTPTLIAGAAGPTTSPFPLLAPLSVGRFPTGTGSTALGGQPPATPPSNITPVAGAGASSSTPGGGVAGRAGKLTPLVAVSTPKS